MGLIERCDVLVVGAGLAGIAAARTLERGGLTSIILEARDRVGGRIHAHDDPSGRSLELGAYWIHGTEDNPIVALCEERGMELRESGLENFVLYDASGERLTASEVAVIGTSLDSLYPALRACGEDQDEDLSVADVLPMVLQGQELTPRDHRVISWGLAEQEMDTGAPLNQLSAWYWDEDEAFEGPDVIPLEGYAALVRMLSQGLDIRLETAALAVHRGPGEIRVTASNGVYEADWVVLTLPIGVLKTDRLHFDPPLPNWKRAAIGALGMGVLEKVVLRFSAPFWEEGYEFLHYMSDVPGEFSEFVVADVTGVDGILVALLGGDFALEMATKTDEYVVGRALDVLRRMYGSAVTMPEETLVTRWSGDPLALGAYPFVKTGALLKDFRTMARPVDKRLLFAGDGTHHLFPGTTHGAWLSGVREAHRILKG